MDERNEIKGMLLVGTAALCWSFVAIALKIAVADLSPSTIVWFRFMLSFLILAAVFFKRDRTKLRILAKPPWLLLLAGLALGANYLGILLGVHYTSPSTTQVVIQFGPISFAVAGVLIFRERLTRRQIFGFLIAMIGLGIFYNRQSLLLIDDIHNFNKGMLWTLLAAAGWCIYAIQQKKLVKYIPSQQMNLIIFIVPALLYTPFVDLAGFTQLNALGWGVIIFLGLNTSVAYSALAEGLKHVEANKASMIIVLNPIVTFLVMWLLGALDVTWIEKEHFTWLSLLGALVLLVGAILVVGARKRRVLS